MNWVVRVLEGVSGLGGSKCLLPQKTHGPISCVVIKGRGNGITFLNVSIFLLLDQRNAITLLSLMDLIFGGHWKIVVPSLARFKERQDNEVPGSGSGPDLT